MSVVRLLSGVEPATRTVSKSVNNSSASARATRGGGGHGRGGAGGGEVDAAHGELQLDEALAVDRLAGDDRDAKLLLKAADADLQAGGFREVHHVHDEDDGAAEIEDLVDEIEVPLEVGGIDDAKDAVGLRRVGAGGGGNDARDRLRPRNGPAPIRAPRE